MVGIADGAEALNNRAPSRRYAWVNWSRDRLRRGRRWNIRCRCGAAFRGGVAGRAGSVLLVDGIHDLGGMQGFGAVVHSPAEPAFHDRWEAVARALLAVVAGAVGASGGEFRHSIERMAPGHYLTSGYYEHWLTAAATLAV